MKDFNTDDDNIPVTSPKVQAPDAIIDQGDLWTLKRAVTLQPNFPKCVET